MFERSRDTAEGARQLLGAPRYRRLAGLATAVYASIFLWLLQDLDLHPPRAELSFELLDPGLLLVRRGTYSFEAVGVLELPLATLLLSPVNVALALTVGFLVGVNLAYSYAAIREPAACSTGNAAGVLAGVPALAAGGACCAPVVFVVLGVQATAGLLALQTFLLPASVAALVSSLVYVSGKVDRSALA